MTDLLAMLCRQRKYWALPLVFVLVPLGYAALWWREHENSPAILVSGCAVVAAVLVLVYVAL